MSYFGKNVKFLKFFFAFSIVKGLSDYVVKILALKFEPKKSYDRKTKFSLCRNALIDPDLAKHKSKQKYVSTYGELLKQRPREGCYGLLFSSLFTFSRQVGINVSHVGAV